MLIIILSCLLILASWDFEDLRWISWTICSIIALSLMTVGWTGLILAPINTPYLIIHGSLYKMTIGSLNSWIWYFMPIFLQTVSTKLSAEPEQSWIISRCQGLSILTFLPLFNILYIKDERLWQPVMWKTQNCKTFMHQFDSDRRLIHNSLCHKELAYKR